MRVTRPAPLQVLQVEKEEPLSAPEPLQVLQDTNLFTFIFDFIVYLYP